MMTGTPYGAMPILEPPANPPLAHTNPILEESKGPGSIAFRCKNK